MEMSYEAFKDILDEYKTTIIMVSDVIDALDFVADLLEAESDATQDSEPYAINTIMDLNKAAMTVRQLGYSISDAMAENGEEY